MKSKWLYRVSITIFFFAVSIYSYAQNLEDNEANNKRVENFGNALEMSIYDENSEAYLALFSIEDFRAKLEDEGSNNSQYRKGFIQGVVGAVSKLPERIIEDTKDGYYDFVNYYYNSDDQNYHVLFRLYNPLGGINYHDYVLVQGSDSENLLFSDMYIYLSGENFSDTLKRLFKASLSTNKKSTNKEFSKLLKVIASYNSGNIEQSLSYADNIQGPLAKDKFFMIYKSIIASQSSEDAYLESLKNLVTVHNDDPTINLNKIDYYLYVEEYANAKVAIEQLMEETQDDFLHLLLGNLSMEQNKFTEAQNSFKYIIDNYEGFFTGQISYFTALVSNENLKEAIEYLETLTLEYDKNDLVDYIEEPEADGSNIYDDFIKTKYYKEWKEL